MIQDESAVPQRAANPTSLETNLLLMEAWNANVGNSLDKCLTQAAYIPVSTDQEAMQLCRFSNKKCVKRY